MKPLDDQTRNLVPSRYCRDPNEDLWGLPGTGWYPAQGGLPQPMQGFAVRIYGGQIHIHPDMGGDSLWSFASREEFTAWCVEHGRISEPGQTHY